MFTKVFAKYGLRTRYDFIHLTQREDFKEIYVALCEAVIADTREAVKYGHIYFS